MKDDTDLLEKARGDLEESLIANNLLVELAATGGVIPRLLVFRPRPDGKAKGWQIQIGSLPEPPSLSRIDEAHKEAISALVSEKEAPEGVACVVYSSEIETIHAKRKPAIVMEWVDLRGNRLAVVVRISDDERSYTIERVAGDLESSVIVKVENDEDSSHGIGPNAGAMLTRISHALTPVFRALAPETDDDAVAYAKVQENKPVWSAIRKFSADMLEGALHLSASRSDAVLSSMSMTISYLRAQLFQQTEDHRDALAKAKTAQEKMVPKAMVKLQRELDMTRKRAETLARQAKEAREEVRALRAARGAPVPTPVTMAVDDTLPMSVLQRRMSSYLRNFESISTR